MSQHEDREHIDVVARDREAWNLPAPKVRAIRGTHTQQTQQDGRVQEPAEVHELDPAA